MSKLDEGLNTGYVKDLKTGNVLPISGRGAIAEIEKQNKDLKKKNQEHLIRFVVVDKPEEKKQAGRPKQEEK